MDTSTVSVLAIAAAAASFFLVGGAWYGALLAGPWRRAAGVGEEQLASGAARVFGGAALLAVIIAASLSAFLGDASVGEGTVIGAVAGTTFAAAPLGIIHLFERRPAALTLIDAGYLVVGFTVAGAVIGAVQ